MSLGGVSAQFTGGGTSTASVTTGTLATMNATTGSNGQLFYNTTYNCLFNWVNDRWWPVSIDPRYGIWIKDEFNGTDRIGSLDWQTGGSSPSSAAPNNLTSGIYKISTASLNSIIYLTTQLNGFQLGAMDIYLEASVSIDQLSNGTDNLSFAFGLNDGVAYSATSACTDGVYLSYTDGTNTNKWIANASSNSTLTSSNSSTAITAATFYRLGIYIAAGTSASFYVNGTKIVTDISTNLPTGAGRQTGISFRVDKVLGTSAVTASLDYIEAYGFFNGKRVT